MIVRVDYRIEKPYDERLSIIESIILEEIERRKKVVDLEVVRQERAHNIVFNSEFGERVCYSCRKPVWFLDDEVLFFEITPDHRFKTYFHLDCVKQKV